MNFYGMDTEQGESFAQLLGQRRSTIVPLSSMA